MNFLLALISFVAAFFGWALTGSSAKEENNVGISLGIFVILLAVAVAYLAGRYA